MSVDQGLVERFLDYLIYPPECIDTFGRTYLDDLDLIAVENHGYDPASKRFSKGETQAWFDRVSASGAFENFDAYVRYVRDHEHSLDIASRRPRLGFSDAIFEELGSYQKLRDGGQSVAASNDFQREYSALGVGNIPLNEKSPDYFELYLSEDRVNPWTYLIRREVASGRLSKDAPTLCIGNRWVGEVLYFRENLGLANTKGVDLFTPDSEITVAADMHDMPFEEKSIGLIFARGLINKSYDVRVFMKEMLRVLKPTGFLIVETPIYRDGFSRLGPTDIKSTANLLRLLKGKIARVIYSDETDPNKTNSVMYNGYNLARFFIQLDQRGGIEEPKIERFSPTRFRYYNAWRLKGTKKRLEAAAKRGFPSR